MKQRKKKKQAPLPPEQKLPKKTEMEENESKKDFGGMDFTNFKKNLGCG